MKDKQLAGNLATLALAITKADDGGVPPFVDRRSEPRLWCSDLVEVAIQQKNRWKKLGHAVLEDISPSGVCLQLNDPVAKGSLLRVQHEDWKAEGEVRYCVHREVGYYVGLQLQGATKWSQDSFRPKHLLDPGRIAPKKKA